MPPARAVALTAAVVSAVFVLGGVVLLVLAPSPSGSFGWFAYAPLQEVRPVRSLVVLGPQQCLGAALVAVGALTAAAVGGYRLGRARASG